MKKRDKRYYGPAKWAEMQAAEMRQMGKNRLKHLKESGVEWVQWLTAGFDECPRCLAMSDKVMRIEEVLFTEHPDCSHARGCRCMWIAVADPNRPPDDEESCHPPRKRG